MIPGALVKLAFLGRLTYGELGTTLSRGYSYAIIYTRGKIAQP